MHRETNQNSNTVDQRRRLGPPMMLKKTLAMTRRPDNTGQTLALQLVQDLPIGPFSKVMLMLGTALTRYSIQVLAGFLHVFMKFLRRILSRRFGFDVEPVALLQDPAGPLGKPLALMLRPFSVTIINVEMHEVEFKREALACEVVLQIKDAIDSQNPSLLPLLPDDIEDARAELIKALESANASTTVATANVALAPVPALELLLVAAKAHSAAVQNVVQARELEPAPIDWVPLATVKFEGALAKFETAKKALANWHRQNMLKSVLSSIGADSKDERLLAALAAAAENEMLQAKHQLKLQQAETARNDKAAAVRPVPSAELFNAHAMTLARYKALCSQVRNETQARLDLLLKQQPNLKFRILDLQAHWARSWTSMAAFERSGDLLAFSAALTPANELLELEMLARQLAEDAEERAKQPTLELTDLAGEGELNEIFDTPRM